MKELFFTAVLACFVSFTGVAQFTISVESGLTFTQYNDVRSPNENSDQGSLFSLENDFQQVESPVYFRAEASYFFNSKHTIEITAAPLVVESKGYEGSLLLFEDKMFEGDQINGRYQFNTYRVSYRYRIISRSKFLADLGATILTRDAVITISQNDNEASNTDLGFVPLISLQARYRINPKLEAMLKGDALVGPQGRAEDFFLGLQYTPSPRFNLKAGYRLIEGGADVDQVYNFAYFHFASFALSYTL